MTYSDVGRFDFMWNVYKVRKTIFESFGSFEMEIWEGLNGEDHQKKCSPESAHFALIMQVFWRFQEVVEIWGILGKNFNHFLRTKFLPILRTKFLSIFEMHHFLENFFEGTLSRYPDR
jgi:hypothetical protein